MKKINIFIISLLLLIIFPVSINADSSLEAERMNVDIKVSETGLMTIVQEIDMNFKTPHRGIFAFIPQKYYDFEYKGKKMDILMPIFNLELLTDDPYEVDDNGDGVVIRIGDPDTFIEGRKTYKYQYNIQLYNWTGNDEDIFYFDVIADKWEFPIKHVDFTLTLPQEIKNEVYFYATSENRPVEHKIEGNKIIASYDEELYLQAITVETSLGDAYFQYPNSDFSHISVISNLSFLGIIVLIYLKYGKDYPLVDSVEFTAPDGLSSAETAYIYRGYLQNEDITSLIIYWASKGYLIIEEISDVEIEFIKIKDLDVDAPSSERMLFKALFKSGERVSGKNLSNKFGVAVQHAKNSIPQSFSQDKERRVFERTGIVFKYLLLIVIPILSMVSYTIFNYANIPSIDNAIGYGLIGFMASLLFSLAGLYVFDHAKEKRPFALKVLFVLLYFGYNLIIYSLMIHALDNTVKIAFVIQAISVLVAIYFIANMSRRTKQGTRWYGQILGLRRFIELAEKDRLERLVEDNPSIFYDILPFAYVLGVTDVWSEKFKDINMQEPDWYRSNSVNFSSYYMWSSLNRQMRIMTPALTSVPSPTGKSGGGFGGGGSGFGGGGGGGFSGGGFGGGGGGGW